MQNPFLSLILLAVLSLGQYSCKNSSTKSTEQAGKVDYDSLAALVPKVTTKAGELPDSLPTIPSALIGKLLLDTDRIDVILHGTMFSMALSDKPQIDDFVTRYIYNLPVNGKLICKNPNGRVFFEKKGSSVSEADIFFAEGCKYFVFMENNIPVYATRIAPIFEKQLTTMFGPDALKGFKVIDEENHTDSH